MFSENSFEIYKNIKKTYITREIFKKIDILIKKKALD